MFQKLFIFFVILLLTIGIASADELPVTPSEFYGGVTVNGAPAPAGTVIVAKMFNGVEHGRITTTVTGQYGDGPGPFDKRLKVNVTGEEYNNCCTSCGCSLAIEFFVNNIKAKVYDVESGGGWVDSYPFEPGVGVDLNLNTGVLPTGTPTAVPTTAPTTQPTTSPTTQPTTSPTTQPTTSGTTQPTTIPTSLPTTSPTTAVPTTSPTAVPTPSCPDSVPAIPHEFYGLAYISESVEAPVGTEIEARADGVFSGTGNPIPVTTQGMYGGPEGFDEKLKVTGCLETGTPLTFYVGNVRADVYDVVAGTGWATTYPFTPGGNTELNLRTNISAPIADFNASPVSGYEPMMVQFTDLSEGPPTSWLWEFGDGTTADIQNPVHRYYNGKYTITLTVSNAAGNDTIIRTGFINVYRVSSPGGGGGGGGGGGDYYAAAATPTPTGNVTPTPTATVTVVPTLPGGTLPLGSNLALSQSVVIASPDNSGTISMVAGTVPTNAEGGPLLTLTIRRIADSDVPPVPGDALFSYAGYAYEIEPSGASFDPYATLAITLSEDDWAGLQGRELFIKWYNPATSAWEDIPATVDAATRTASAKITHTSIFALFAENLPATAPTTPVPTAAPSLIPGLSMVWIALIIVVVAIVIVVVFIIQRRKWSREQTQSDDENWKME
jgi:PKD repeat protein